MNRDLDSLLRGPGAIAAVLAVVLAVLWALVSQGLTQYIVPRPDQVGQTFFTSLKAHNFDAAHALLSQPLQQSVSPETLRELTRQLEQAASGIDQASGENPREQDQSATADVQVKLANGTERTVQVPFTREHGLWHISSLAPLEVLLGS